MESDTDFYRRIEYHAQQHPEKAAFVFHQSKETVRVTYPQLLADIETRAATLEGLTPGDLVFVISATDYHGMLVYLACLRLGAIPAFIAPLTPRQDSRIHAQELDALMEKFSPAFVFRGGEWLARGREQMVERSKLPGFLQFSSGTTRLKKGVFIPLKKLNRQLRALGQALAVDIADQIACWLPLYHDMGLISSFFFPLYHGLTVHYLDPVVWSYKPNLLLEMIEKEGATLCWQPNFAFGHLLNYYRSSGQIVPDLSSLRCWISCSEVCKKTTFQRFEAFFAPKGLKPGVLQCSYAMAENVFAVTQTHFLQDVAAMPTYQDIVSSGLVLTGNQIRLADLENGVGEIQIAGDTLFGGYCGDDSHRFTEDGWYQTGDLGLIEDGHLFVVGRTDDVVIISGKKIQAHYIEALVSENQAVKPGRVLATANSEGSGLCVYYEGESLLPKDQMALRQQVNATSCIAIDRFVLLEANTLVKSTSGKIARKKSLQKLETLILNEDV